MASAPDGDVDRRLESRWRHARRRRAHQVHGLWSAEEAAQRASGGAAMVPFQQRRVPAFLDRQSGHVNHGQFAAAELLGDQVLDGGRDTRPVSGRRPRRGLAGQHADVAVRYAQPGEQPEGCAARIGTRRSDQPLPASGRAAELAFTGRTVRAAEAFRIGLADRLIDTGTALDAALEMAETIAENSDDRVRSTKNALVRNLENNSFGSALEVDNRGQALVVQVPTTASMLVKLKAEAP